MPKEIVLDLKPKENKWRSYAPLVLVVAGATFLIFTLGFAAGKFTQFPVPLIGSKNEATPSATRKDWFVYEAAKFSIEYPKGWKARKNLQDEPEGVTVETDGGRVQVWITPVREYRFSKEQKDKQEDVKERKLSVDGREAAVKEFSYKDGDFFIVVEIPSGEDKPKVITWIGAANSEFKTAALETIKTLKTKKAPEEKSDE